MLVEVGRIASPQPTLLWYVPWQPQHLARARVAVKRERAMTCMHQPSTQRRPMLLYSCLSTLHVPYSPHASVVLRSWSCGVVAWGCAGTG